MIRLGGPLYADASTPEAWVAAVERHGYRAAFCPVGPSSPPDEIAQYAEAAARADIVIAEVGAWSNPLSANHGEREAALRKCKEGLALAEAIGARCCVNIAGSRGDQWDGPHPENLTDETFQLIVKSVQDIIDSVQPQRAFYALETMPWIFPDCPQNYLRLVEAIDRKQFAVHLDPVNMINSPQRFFHNAAFIRECFDLLGPLIQTCHAKDIALRGQLTVHLDEVRPGLGGLDYSVFLRELDRLPGDIPLMLEHLPNEEEYRLAADHVRAIAGAEGIGL